MKPSSAASAALLGGVTVAVLVSPFYIRPPYYRHGDACSPSYCYRTLDELDASSSGTATNVDNDASACAPDRWSSIPCALGVKNECGSSPSGQSPIDFTSDVAESCVESRCIDGSGGGLRLPSSSSDIDGGGDGDTPCSFLDLTSTLHVRRGATATYPSDGSCRRPSVIVAPHHDSDDSEQEWELEQMRFHVGGSEHTIAGVRYDGEVQLLHRSKQKRKGGEGAILVVALMVSASDDYDDEYNDNGGDDGYDLGNGLEPIFVAFEGVLASSSSSCPSRRKAARVSSARNSDLVLGSDTLAAAVSQGGWTPYQLLPSPALWNDGYGGGNTAVGAFSYTGSLTMPPCSVGVEWYVVDAPQVVSAAQWNRLVKVVNGIGSYSSCGGEEGDSDRSTSLIGAFRPTQTLSGRAVQHHCTL